MERKILFIIIAVLLATSASAASSCEDKLSPLKTCTMFTPTITCSNYNYDVLNSTNIIIDNGNLTLVNESIYKFEFNQTTGSYLVRLCDGSTREIIVEGEDRMASLAITFFILLINIAIFMAAFMTHRFVETEMYHLLIKRSLFIFGTYLMVLNSAIMATISAVGTLGLEKEMYLYMQLFGWGGYILIVFTIVKTIFDATKLMRENSHKKRMGQ